MYKKVLTTNPLKREEKDFFYVDLLRGSKNRRTLPNINTLKREESIPTRAFDTPLTSTKPIDRLPIVRAPFATRHACRHVVVVIEQQQQQHREEEKEFRNHRQEDERRKERARFVVFKRFFKVDNKGGRAFFFVVVVRPFRTPNENREIGNRTRERSGVSKPRAVGTRQNKRVLGDF